VTCAQVVGGKKDEEKRGKGKKKEKKKKKKETLKDTRKTKREKVRNGPNRLQLGLVIKITPSSGVWA
jgi:hypothetical protein